MTGPRVGVFHPGTQHSWQTALAFQESGQLAWYATSVFYDPKRWPYRIERWLPSGLLGRVNREFRRRHTPLLDPSLVRTFGIDEWLETGARRLGWRRWSQRFNARGNTRFADGVIRLIERTPVDVLWGYNSSSLEVFRWAKERGIICVLDQTIGHPRSLYRVMAEERGRHPDFFFDGQPSRDENEMRRQDEEVALADLVVVGSEFCRRTMIENGCPAEKLRIVPYGFDETLFPEAPLPRHFAAGRPVEFLFLGSLDPRKGIAYLLRAFESVAPSRASLSLVGALSIPSSTFRRYADRVRHIPHVPHHEIARYLGAADVLIFPTLFEGGGIVLYEAAGAGLGIVQSTACAPVVAPDCPNGIVLEEVSIASVREAVERVLDDPTCVESWSRASCERRAQWTWDVYRRRARELASR